MCKPAPASPRLPCLQLYGWPFGLTPKWRRLADPVKQAGWDALAAAAARLDCRRWCGWRQGSARQPPPALPPAAAELPLATQLQAPLTKAGSGELL